MYQFFSKPDRYLGRCGDLRFSVVKRRIPRAPRFMHGVRALFLTDIHAADDTTDGDMAAFARRIASTEPDIVFWGGDYADRTVNASRLFRHLAGIKPRLGSFAVVGNNDREAWPDPERLRAEMASVGIQLLVNRSAAVDVRGGTLIVAGIDEYLHGSPDAEGLYPGAASGTCYRVLLSHYPIPPKQKPDLMLCGHTHGGQFNLLGVTPYSLGFERVFSRGRAVEGIDGLRDRGGLQTLVSKGIGASRIPLRVGVRPEAELLRFE